jgi:hypothetical protein
MPSIPGISTRRPPRLALLVGRQVGAPVALVVGLLASALDADEAGLAQALASGCSCNACSSAQVGGMNPYSNHMPITVCRT